MRHYLLAFGLFFAFASISIAQDEEVPQEMDMEEFELLYRQFTDSLNSTFTYQFDSVVIGNDLARIIIPKGYKFLDGKTADMVIEDIWGNPPRDEADKSLGMLLPSSSTPFNDSSFAINITYSEEGYVEDEDAADIDYDELLEDMQSDSKEINKLREEQGYESVHLVGWASPPFYDAQNKKLHWAKELKFGDAPMNTLNYNIRILGRKGFLELNAIGEMFVLNDVKNNIDDVLTSVDFTEGNTYDDFDPEYDKIAAYGIGGLIAGKALAKAGILAKLGLLLAKFWKVAAIAVVAFFAGIKKFFTKPKVTPYKKEEEENLNSENENEEVT